MKACDVMTRTPVTANADMSLEDAVNLMLKTRVSGLPVVDPQGMVIGMLTEGDLLRRVELGTAGPAASWFATFVAPGRAAAGYVRTHGKRVEDIMTTQVISITTDTSLAEIVALMEARQVKRFPVVQQHRLIGIVSRSDLLRALVKLLPERRIAALSDAELRRRVLSEIDKQPWAPRQTIDATVENGIVELRGVVTDDRERVGLRVIVENTPGVKGIDDKLMWMEPISGTLIDRPKE